MRLVFWTIKFKVFSPQISSNPMSKKVSLNKFEKWYVLFWYLKYMKNTWYTNIVQDTTTFTVHSVTMKYLFSWDREFSLVISVCYENLRSVTTTMFSSSNSIKDKNIKKTLLLKFLLIWCWKGKSWGKYAENSLLSCPVDQATPVTLEAMSVQRQFFRMLLLESYFFWWELDWSLYFVRGGLERW